MSRANKSIGECDYLSYSYSCIKEFEQNQQTIGTLANLMKNNTQPIIDQNPKLFTMSGDRDNAIYQPFYYRAEGDQNATCVIQNYENINYETSSVLNMHNDFKPGAPNFCYEEESVPERNLIFQWIRYQFRYINNLWPFFRPMDDCFTRIFKKNQQLSKMEMLLHNVNVNTKQKIKSYINTLRLKVDERTTLCNETIMEIDITPIMADRNRLQDFLNFLRNTELNASETDDNDKPASKYFENKTVTLKKTISYCNKDLKTFHPRKFDCETINIPFMQENKINMNLHQNQQSNLNDKMNLQRHKGNNKENNYVPYKPIEQPLKNEKEIIKEPRMFTEVNLPVYKRSKIFKKDKCELYSKIQAKYNVENIYSGDNDITAQSDAFPQINKKIIKNDLNVTERGDFCSLQTDKNNSCKCLIHKDREDFYRYKNQCLFGKGDEINNSFIKYLTIQENNSKMNIHSKMKNKFVSYTENKNNHDFSKQTRLSSLGKPITKGKIRDFIKPYAMSYDWMKNNIHKKFYHNNLGSLENSITKQNNYEYCIEHHHNNTKQDQDNKLAIKIDSNEIICPSIPQLNSQCLKACFESSCNDFVGNTTIPSSETNTLKTKRKSKIETTGVDYKQYPRTQSSNEYCFTCLPTTPYIEQLKGANKITDNHRKLNLNSKKERFIRYLNKNNKRSEDFRATVVNNLEDDKLKSLLQENLDFDNNDETKIDIVVKNLEELKAKKLYLKSCLEAHNRNKGNKMFHVDQFDDSFPRENSRQYINAETNRLINSNNNLDYTSDTVTTDDTTNKSLKYYFGPRPIIKSISSVCKLSNNKSCEDISKINDSRINRFYLQNANKNKCNFNEDMSLDLMKQHVNGYLTNTNTDEPQSNFEQSSIHDSTNLEKLHIELRQQSEQIDSLKKLLWKCLNNTGVI